MKILITGSRGQLGNELQRCLSTMTAEIGPIPSGYEGAQVDAVDADVLDITDKDAIDAWFISNGPYDIVINGAAMTNVDGCEQEEDAANAVNGQGPANLAMACEALGAKFVQVSTDYVFPGNVPGERIESDEVAPLSAYGRSKLLGEQATAKHCSRHFIVRTAWLYGYVGHNFVKAMRKIGQTRDQITVVNDQLGNPTSANDLAYEILKIALTDDYGIYHCTGKGTCSWCDFATAIMEGLGLDCKVVPVTSEQYKAANPASADRPAYSSLRNEHLEKTVGDEMRPWRDALVTYLQNLPDLEG
ncbi:MAG TPA: dTDP-4-dehydrorhamnose reductase [Collinsella ihuae]|uniref:dTDP-4-dehydrorhamnose reductase n=1 Tax=Collinsella ihumii TaxID=1720204 RepID=A0A921LR75_9ACTN|nr:dTDP-4-dehydrorhamnose reductase [Collinsella ihumii]